MEKIFPIMMANSTFGHVFTAIMYKFIFLSEAAKKSF